jgi:hypothetical protein
MINENKPIITSYNSPDEVPEELDPNAKETYKNILRQKRNQLLKDTDIYLIPDFPITPENLILIKQYRQQLRDFTNNDYIIPEKPF